MSPITKFFKDNWQLMIWLTLAGFAMTLIWYHPWETGRNNVQFMKIGFLTASIWNILWFGNNFSAHFLSEKISWTKEPVKRLIVGLIVTVLFTFAAVYMVAGMFNLVLDLDITGDMTGTIISSLIITIVISLFMHGRSFLYSWREEAVNAERLHRENLKSQYDSLRSQVNPHFLFNSLNALTNLVYEDPDKAARFIKQLSEVYRYVLETRDKELVPLEDELKFLESYLFLQRIRFGNKLKVEVNLKGDQKVAPLVLQMLIENAIKHNVISDENPLNIRLFQDNGWMVVENNLKAKKTLPEESTGIGLANIRSRYGYFSDQPVQVESDSERFIVKLPVIQAEL